MEENKEEIVIENEVTASESKVELGETTGSETQDSEVSHETEEKSEVAE